jgi:hypothetical protein
MRRAVRLLALIPLAIAATTCAPGLGPGDALLTSTRILAVRAEPAEASPGTEVSFTTLVASPAGPMSDAGIVWGFCTTPNPLTSDNAVSSACLALSSLAAAGAGPTTTAPTPGNGCSVFGPDTTAINQSPRAPDGTGGYYQPLRLALSGTDDTFALVRIRCDLPQAPATAAETFAAEYRDNNNPELLPLTATVGEAPVDLAAVPAGSRVTLEASWPPSSAETFAYFDPVSQTVTAQRESMQVAWYTTAGSLDTEATGRASDDMATTGKNGWAAPGAPATVFLWTVLRDSRGGVAFAAYQAVVQ